MNNEMQTAIKDKADRPLMISHQNHVLRRPYQPPVAIRLDLGGITRAGGGVANDSDVLGPS